MREGSQGANTLPRQLFNVRIPRKIAVESDAEVLCFMTGGKISVTKVTVGTKVTFLWIPGHSGIRGNEQADYHAKQALLLTQISDIPFDSTSMKTSVRFHCQALWQRTWNDVGAQSHLHPIKPVIGSWSSSNRPARQEEIVLSRLRIGHIYI